MKIYYINCRKIDNIGDFYKILGKKLDFPEYFGNNLDALHDVLTERREPTKIRLWGFDRFAKKLGEKGECLREVLKAAQEENPKLNIK